jgi:hypothetical protein
MRPLHIALCGVLLAGGVANAVPVDCTTMTTLAQYVAQNAGGGCFIQDKLYTGFSYSGGGAITTANVNVKVVFNTIAGGPLDIHGFVLTTAAGLPVWSVGFTWGYTISVSPPNPSVNINSAKLQANFGNLSPNPASARTTKGNGLIQNASLGSETDNDSFAPVQSLTSSTTVTIPPGGFLISLKEIYTQQTEVPDVARAKMDLPDGLSVRAR